MKLSRIVSKGPIASTSKTFVIALLAMTFGFTGCQTTPSKQSTDTQQLKALEKQVATDPQAQSALRSINTALSPVHTVKYCPEDGQRFSPEVIWCPDHKVKLEWVD